MELRRGRIPGVKELSDIGYERYYCVRNYYYGEKRTMQGCYDIVMAKPKCAVVVASLTVDQVDGIKLLLNNGFEKVGRAKRNPNSRNKILLFVKHIGKQKGK